MKRYFFTREHWVHVKSDTAGIVGVLAILALLIWGLAS